MLKILPVLFLFLSSCTTQKDKNISLTGTPAIPVKGEVITSDLMAYHTMQSAYIQSHLFYFTPTDDQVCLIVDPKQGAETGTFGRFGNGPGELNLFPVYAGKSEQGDTIYMFDRNHKVNIYTLKINSNGTRYDFIRSLPVERGSKVGNISSTLIQMQKLDNGYYVGLNIIHTRYLFSLYDSNLKHLKDFGEFPISNLPENFFFLTPFEGPLTAYGNQFFYATKRFGYMVKYEISNVGEVTKVWDHTYSPPHYRLSNGEIKFSGTENLHGFSDIAVGKDYVFALYSGIPCGKMFKERSIYAIEPKTLVILDHHGNIVQKYGLENPCNTLCLSEDEKYIYLKTSHPDIGIERFSVDDLIK